MTTSSDEQPVMPRPRLMLPVLAILLALAVKFGFTVNTWLILEPTGRDLHVRQTLFVYGMSLLLIATIAIVSRLKPSKATIVALLALLAMVALYGISATEALWRAQSADFPTWNDWYWRVKVIFAANLLIIAGAAWGLLSLQPWRLLRRAEDEPVSPAIRKSRKLFGIAGITAILAVVAVGIGTRGNTGNPIWSNSQNVSVAFALIAIVIWIAGMALSWWWYASADEHERRANDVGFLAGGGLFVAVTPVWWIGSRAGLLPPPDAMILWYATVLVMWLGWWRYRSR